MFLRVDLSKEPFQLLYRQIYQRISSFIYQFNDPPENINAALSLLVAGDKNIYLLINVNDQGLIDAHCFCTLQPVGPNATVIFVDQMQIDDAKDSSKFMEQATFYMESLPNVVRIVMVTTETRFKAFQKKYGFNIHKVIMHRDIKKELP